MPRRRAGTLLPLEQEILHAGVRFGARAERFYGFGIAASLKHGHHGLISHGTLYKALARLQDAGLLQAVWEDHTIAEAAGRPRRKLYEVTSAGEAALRAAEQQEKPASLTALRPSTQ